MFFMFNESFRYSIIRELIILFYIFVSVIIGLLMSCDVRFLVFLSYMSIQIILLVFSFNVDFDFMFLMFIGCYILVDIFSLLGIFEDIFCEF